MVVISVAAGSLKLQTSIKNFLMAAVMVAAAVTALTDIGTPGALSALETALTDGLDLSDPGLDRCCHAVELLEADPLLPIAESADAPEPVLSFPLRLKGRLEWRRDEQPALFWLAWALYAAAGLVMAVFALGLMLGVSTPLPLR